MVKDMTIRIGDSIKKINKALCSLYNVVVTYGGRGKLALKDHIIKEAHFFKLKETIIS